MLYIFPCYILDIRIKNIYIKNNNILTDKQIIEIANLKDYPNYYKTNTFKIIKELDDYILTIKCDNNELLSKAINYYLNQKDELYTYLDCGYTDMQPGRKGCLGLCHCKEFFLIL